MQAAASLLVEAFEVAVAVAVAVRGDARWSSLLEAIFHFSFLESCFICSSLHSKLQNAVSPLKQNDFVSIRKPKLH